MWAYGLKKQEAIYDMYQYLLRRTANSNTLHTVLDTSIITDFVLLVGRTDNDHIDDVVLMPEVAQQLSDANVETSMQSESIPKTTVRKCLLLHQHQ